MTFVTKLANQYLLSIANPQLVYKAPRKRGYFICLPNLTL